ncbi:hypothetical protein MP228_002333 [Amoeboaphelidium protococcarum]|nr:hypothetical protein MP228_002333 [Amoeboaphelidium protococcarum]
MSKLDSLIIRGFRSFDPNSSQQIMFQTPLTLIVGQNGSGKTTIVECLKYITTGEMPSGAKGVSFVHDPKVSNEREVKAQVRLLFNSQQNELCLAVRSLQVTVTRGKASCKTLDGVIKRRDPVTGDEVSISSRCASLDTEIPALLGVSKAILENVIFTHQEDSFWPFAEPAALKKKFDDIFAATQYTKALVTLKDVRKEKTAQLNVELKELEHLEFNSERAQKIRVHLAEVKQKILDRRSSVQQDQNLSLKLQKELDHLLDELQQIKELSSKYERLQSEINNYRQQIQQLQSSVPAIDDSEDEIRVKLATCQEQIGNLAKDEESIAQRRSELKVKNEKLNQQLSNLASQIGKIEAQIEHSHLLQSQLDLLYTAQQSEYGIPHSQGGDQVYDELLQKLANSQRALDQVSAEKQTKLRDITDRINIVQRDSVVASGKIKDKRSTRSRNIQNLSELLNQMNQLSQQGRDLDKMRGELNDLQVQMESQQAQIESQNFSQQEAQTESEAQDINRKLIALRDQLSIVNQSVEQRAKLSLKQSELSSAQSSHDRLKQSCVSDLLNVVGVVPEDLDVVEYISSQYLAYSEKCNSLEDKSQNEKMQLQNIANKISFREEQQQKLQSKVQQLESSIEQVCAVDDFEQVLKDVKEQIDQSSQQQLVNQNSQEVYEYLLQQANADSCCPLCSNGLDSQSLNVMKDKVKQIAASLPKQSNDIRIRLQQLNKKYEQLMKLQPQVDQLLSLKSNEIKQLTSELSNLRGVQRKQLGECEETQQELDLLKSELALFTDLKEKSRELSQLNTQIKSLQDECCLLQTNLDSAGVGDSGDQSAVDIQSQIDALTMQETQLSTQLQQIRRQKDDQMQQLSQITKNYNALNLQVVELAGNLSKLEDLRKKRSELQGANADLERDIKELESSVSLYGPQLKELEAEHQSIMTDYQQKENVQQKEIQKLQQVINQLQSLRDQIKQMEIGRFESQLAEYRDEQKAMSIQKNSLESQMNAVNEEIAALSQRSNTLEIDIRKYQDTLRMLSIETAVKNLSGQMIDLEGRMKVADAARVQRTVDAKRQQLEECNAKKAGMQGELRQLQIQRESYESSLGDDYKDIDDQLRGQRIKVKTAQVATQDLEKYSKALESAILKFHSMKMEEINKIIRHLWQSTYRGNDIDSIMICSDVDSTNEKKSTTTTQRSYNYRVVMQKGDTQMDIRGRCSAGQKVLASLIIRLALAETFCINCGILALDEPTTNLDEDNAASLAESLHRIIEIRRQQANFQLIIITHDEQFMRLLGAHEYAEGFFRVSKNMSGYSNIEFRRFNQAT